MLFKMYHNHLLGNDTLDGDNLLEIRQWFDNPGGILIIIGKSQYPVGPNGDDDELTDNLGPLVRFVNLDVLDRSVDSLLGPATFETEASTVADLKEGRRPMSHERGFDATKPRSFLILVTCRLVTVQ